MKWKLWIIMLLVLGIVPAAASANTAITDVVKFTCNDDEATIKSKGAASVTAQNLNVYIGTDQVNSNNQNPVVKAFDASNGAVVFCRDDYEATAVDGKGRGLHWSGQHLYGFFSVDGGSSTAFTAAASNNNQYWTRSVGPASGAKSFAVVGRIDLANGNLTGAAFITARLESGNSNSVGIDGVQCTNTGNLRLLTSSYFSPRRIDGNRMTNNSAGDSPFDYTIEFTPDLKTVEFVSAPGWQTLGNPSNVVACDHGTGFDGNLVYNFGFDDQFQGYRFLGGVNRTHTNDNVLQMNRTGTGGTVGVAQVFDGVRFPSGMKFRASVNLGNSGTGTKQVTFIAVDPARRAVNEGRVLCNFDVPPGAHVQTYEMEGTVPSDWPNPAIAVLMRDNNGGGDLRVDNFIFRENAGLSGDHSCTSGAVPMNTNLVQNSSFGQGEQDYRFIGRINQNVSGGVMQLSRSGNLAVMLQEFGQISGLTRDSKLEATFQFGNTGSETKRITVLLADPTRYNGPGRSIRCNFDVPPNSGLQTFTVSGVAGAPWNAVGVGIRLNNTNNGDLLVDDVDVRYKPYANINGKTCDAPPMFSAEAQAVLDLVNTERCANGVAPVSLNFELVAAAERHSNDMAYNMVGDEFSHTGTDNSTFDQRIREAGYGGSPVGENIAVGYTSTSSVMNGWMNSPGHRANILRSGTNEMGLSLVYNPDSYWRYYWTQKFGSRSGAPQLTCADLGLPVGGAGAVEAAAVDSIGAGFLGSAISIDDADTPQDPSVTMQSLETVPEEPVATEEAAAPVIQEIVVDEVQMDEITIDTPENTSD